MKIKKLLALLLCLCLVLPLCSAAFATGNDGEPAAATATATPAADPAEPAAATPTPETPAADPAATPTPAADPETPAADPTEAPACNCGAEGDAAHAETCPLYVAPTASTATPAVPADPTPAVACTCDATEEQKAAEGFVHAEGCPLYVDTTAQDAAAFYDAIMACSSIDEVGAAIAQIGNDKSEKLYEALTAEEQEALDTHVQTLHEAYLETLVVDVEQPARNYSNVASFRELLATMQTRPQLRRAARAATQSDTEGLELKKSVKDNQDGTYTINLEAYTTGEIKTSTGVKPVDIVLMVDMSTSMENNFSDSGDVYTEVYESDLNKGGRYYVESYYGYRPVTWCDTCNAWTAGCWDGWNHHEGTPYTPKTSSEDATQGSVQFYTRESVQSMSRLEALKKAATSFITDVADKGNNRIAIVGFHDYAVSLSDGFHDATADETILKNAINGIGTNDLKAATDHDDALEAAEALFQGSDTSAAERQRVVVLFTDGEPEPLNDGDWSSATVRNAVESAYRLKNTYAAAVYCISVAPGTDAASMSSPMDKYMSYVSSNYPNARYTGSQITRGNRESELDYEQRVVNQITPGAQADISKGSFYLSASSMSALQNIFQQIASQTGGSSISLGSSAVVKDIVTPYFNMPDNASNVTVQAIDCLSYDTATGEATWGTTGTTLTEAVTIEGSQIGVTGFDFDRNFVSETGRVEGDVTQAGNFHGRKLVISFTITQKEGFLGGNGVATNGAESGVYDKDGALVENFVVPTVDVPLATVAVTAADKDVYLLGSLSGDDLRSGAAVTATKDGKTYTIDMSKADNTEEPYGLAPWQTEYVSFDLTADPAAGYTGLTDDKTFTLTATIKPTVTGTQSANSANDTGDVHVYKPELTAADSTIYLGETADYAANFDAATGIAWKHGTTVADTTTMGEAPVLSIGYNPTAGAFTQDTDVKMTTAIGQNDVTAHTTFINTTDDHDNGTDMHQFTVFVKTCSLTVTKAGSGSMTNGTETHIFTVTGPNGISLKIAVQGNDSKTIVGLPVGEYTVTEDTNWSWRYADNKTGSATLSSTAPDGTVTITNANPTTKWLSGDNFKVNTFAAPVNTAVPYAAPTQQSAAAPLAELKVAGAAPAILPDGAVQLGINE